MTRVLRLVMRGFKSFANKTELVFGTRYNVVLGPNGSGKSNVMDAICFVLGKSSSRELRAERAANLIYNGGKTKSPAKDGEVSIYFDNTDKTFPTEEPYVKISRLVKQNGTSVYKINDETRTRAQIIELLGLANIDPNGYNIILQGDIVRFVEMTSVERRGIVEQIAGISVYEERKEKALRELGKVEESLKEATIIMSERETYLKDLRKERDQAMKYNDLKEKVQVSKASFLDKKIRSKKDELEKIEKEMGDAKKKVDESQAEIDEFKKIIREKKDEIKRISDEIEEKGETSQVALHKDVEGLRIHLATGEQKIGTFEGEIQRVAQRRDELYKSLGEIEGKLKDIESKISEYASYKQEKQTELSGYDKKISDFKKKHNLEDSSDIDSKIEEIDKSADEKQKEIQSLREEQQHLLREKDKTEYRIATLDEQVDKVREIQKENEKELSGLKDKKAEFKKITVELTKLLNEDSSLASQLGNARSKYLKIKGDVASLTVKNISIQERFAGDIAIQKILESKGKLKGIIGKVTDLGEVSGKYAMALEVAAGPRLKSIVVETDADAANCIKYLKQNKLGTATFLPLNKLKAPPEKDDAKKLASANGVQGLAVDLVRAEPRYKKVFQYVFGSTLIVDDIEVARRIGIGKFRMATLDGDLAETSGAMQGGFRRRTTGAAFKEKELSADIEKLEKDEADTQTVIRTLEKRKQEIEDKIAELRQAKANLEGDIIRIEKSLHLEDSDLDASGDQKKELDKELKGTDKRLDEVQDKLSGLNKELAQMKMDRQELRSQISELRNPTKLAELNTFEEKYRQIKEELITGAGELKAMENQASDILRPEREKIQKIIKQHDKEEAEFRQKVKESKEVLRQQKESLKQKEKDEKEFYTQFKQMFNQRNKMNDEIQKIENKLILKEEQVRRTEQKNNSVLVDHARVNTELTGLLEEFKEVEGVRIIQNKSLEDLHIEMKEAQRAMDRMGNVNMKALEVYDTVQKEYDELMKKRGRLETEKADVLIMMNEIEAKKTEMFLKTFKEVDENFQKIFSALFTKGDASLVLEEPDRPFEAGVRIRVRLTGTKHLDIRSLSGGEKTLTALAFIFSIQEHNPASFYILDEVDAALDKRNSEKLSQLLRKYSDKAEYIIISHNDGIISEADNLYGVSMNEHGISKIVSLKV